MINNNFFIDIPEREGTPAAKIFIKILSNNKTDLESKPYVFIFPGGPGANHSHYEDYSCLVGYGNIVFLDPRGCGLSSKADPSTYTIENHIEDVEIIRQHLGLKSIIVLGKSCGAITAIGYTLKFASVVSKLILSAGAASFKFLETSKENVLKRGSLEQQIACETLWQGNFGRDEEVAQFLKTMAPLYSYKSKIGCLKQPKSSPKYAISHEALNNGFKHFLREFNFEEHLHLIRCKTLILAGEEDWITDKIHSEYMSSKISNNRLIIFEKSSHMMEIDVPEQYFNAIKEFISL